MAQQTNPLVLPVTNLMGYQVFNDQGKHIGEIEDLAIDLDYGVIAYAVLSFGGFLGIGDKWFAIPWEAMVLDTENEMFVLDVDMEALKKAEGFDKDDWPDMANYRWGQTIYRYYGYEPYWMIDEIE